VAVEKPRPYETNHLPGRGGGVNSRSQNPYRRSSHILFKRVVNANSIRDLLAGLILYLGFGFLGEALFKDRGWPTESGRAIVSHGWGLCSRFEPRSLLEKAIYAADELVGLVTACAPVRPSKSVFPTNILSCRPHRGGEGQNHRRFSELEPPRRGLSHLRGSRVHLRFACEHQLQCAGGTDHPRAVGRLLMLCGDRTGLPGDG
jgi:hypothetical protein